MGAGTRRVVALTLAAALLAATAGVASARDSIGSVSATPKTLAFGRVAVGTTATSSFWITNGTKAALLVTSIQGSSGDFTSLGGGTTSDCFEYVVTGTLLQPGESCGTAVSFQPASRGGTTGSMSFGFTDGVRTLGLVEAFSGSGT